MNIKENDHQFKKLLILKNNNIIGNVRRTGGKYECSGWGGKWLSFAKPLAYFFSCLRGFKYIHTNIQ